MQDRFKFRIWDKKLKKLASWNDNPYHNMEIMNYICVDNPVTDWKHEDYILMQSTGLKDKNGKLIYEKDFVKNFDNRIYQVFWVDDAACFMVENIRTKTKQGIYSLISLKNDLEVIGNIYENSEL